jgi:hypothetical protein
VQVIAMRKIKQVARPFSVIRYRDDGSRWFYTVTQTLETAHAVVSGLLRRKRGQKIEIRFRGDVVFTHEAA